MTFHDWLGWIFGWINWYLRTMFWSDKVEVDNIRSWHFIFIVFFLSFPIGSTRYTSSVFGNSRNAGWNMGFPQVFWFHFNFEWKNAKLSAHVLFSDQVRWVNVFPTGHQGASEKDQNGAGLHQPVIANWRKRANAFRGSISAGLRSAGLIHLEVPLVPIALRARHFTPAGLLG